MFSCQTSEPCKSPSKKRRVMTYSAPPRQPSTLTVCIYLRRNHVYTYKNAQKLMEDWPEGTFEISKAKAVAVYLQATSSYNTGRHLISIEQSLTYHSTDGMASTAGQSPIFSILSTSIQPFGNLWHAMMGMKHIYSMIYGKMRRDEDS